MNATPAAAPQADETPDFEGRLPQEYLAIGEKFSASHGHCSDCDVEVHTLWWGFGEDRDGKVYCGQYDYCPTPFCDGTFIPYRNFEG